jgi:hypothetical protein
MVTNLLSILEFAMHTTQTLIQLDDKMGVIVLTNTNDSNPSDIARQLIATVGQAAAKASAPKPTTVTRDPTWRVSPGATAEAAETRRSCCSIRSS